MKRTVVLAALVLSGCMSSDVRHMASIDQTDRSITVPVGSYGALGGIKDRLQRAGWAVVVDAGPRVTTGRTGPDTALQTGGTYNTRYRLYLRQSQFDICITGGPALNYDLAIIDNTSGAEALTMSGQECGPDIMSKFAKAISG